MNGLKLKYAILCLILAVLFAYPFVLLPFGTDQSIFAYIGSIINKGGMPYLEAWDVKPPLIYYIYSLGLRVFGHSMIGIRCFDFLYFGITIYAIYHLGTLLFDRKAGVCAGVILGTLYFFTNNFWSCSQAESFLILPMILSVYFCCCGIKKNSMLRLLCSGFFLGIVFMTKLNGIVMVIPIGLYIVYKAFYPVENREVRHLAISLFIVFIGFLLSTGGIVLWFCIRGALSEMYTTLFVYDPAYLSSASELKTDYVHLSLFGFMRRYLFILIPALLALFVINDNKKISGTMLVFSWFFSALLGFFMQRRLYHYHIVPVIVPLALMGAQGYVDLWSSPFWNQKFIFAKRKSLIALIVVLLFISAVWPHVILTYQFTRMLVKKDGMLELYDQYFQAPGVFSLRTTINAATYIKEHSVQGDYIFVWGFQPLLYFLAERDAPTRFFFNAPLLAPFNPRLYDWRQEVIAAIQKTPPRYIIVADQDVLINNLMAGTNTDSQSALQGFPELTAILRVQYVYEKRIDNLLVYRRIGK